MADVRLVTVLLMLISSSMCEFGHVITKRDLKSKKVAFEIDLPHEEKDFLKSTPSRPTKLTKLKASSFSAQGFTAQTKLDFTISNREDVPDTIDVKRVDSRSCLLIVTGPIDRDTLDFAKYPDDKIVLMVKATSLDNPEISATMKVNLVLEDSNDCPPVFTEDTFYAELMAMSLPQDVNPVLRVAATDADKPDDGNGRVTYAISGIHRIRTKDGVRENVADPGSLFGIDAATGNIEVRAQINGAKSSKFFILVVASDNPTYGKPFRATATVTIVITDSPPVCSPEPVVCTVPEDFPVETNLPESCNIKCSDLDESQSTELVYTTTASNNVYTCPIKVLPGGVVQLSQSLDWEADSEHRCIITLEYPGLAHTTYQRFTLNVEDVYEQTRPTRPTRRTRPTRPTRPTSTPFTTTTTTTEEKPSHDDPECDGSECGRPECEGPECGSPECEGPECNKPKAPVPVGPCGPCPGAPCCTDCLVKVLCHCHNASHPGFHIVVFVNSTLQTYEAQFGPPGSGRECSSTVSTRWLPTGEIPYTHRYGIDADQCGTKLSIINQPSDLKTIIVFENTLKLTQKLSKSPFVILDEIDFTIGCNCTVEASASANFTVLRKHRTVMNNDTTDVKLSIYCGEERCCFENEEPNGDRDCCKKDVTECCLKEDVCVHASWEGGPMPMLDELEIFPLNCWATPYSPADSVPRQDLITDGCGIPEFRMEFSGTSGHFCFQAFRFREDQKQVFVHCQLMICDKTDTDSLCSQKKLSCSGPNGRRKRSVDSGNYLSFREVKVGPIVINDALHTAKVIQPQRNQEGFGRRIDEMLRGLKKSRALRKLRKSRI